MKGIQKELDINSNSKLHVEIGLHPYMPHFPFSNIFHSTMQVINVPLFQSLQFHGEQQKNSPFTVVHQFPKGIRCPST